MSKFEEDLELYFKEKEAEERYSRTLASQTVSNQELLEQEKGCKKYVNARGELVREYDDFTITG